MEDLSDEVGYKRQKPNISVLPHRDIRLDGFEYFPVWSHKRQRCKYPGCKINFASINLMIAFDLSINKQIYEVYEISYKYDF